MAVDGSGFVDMGLAPELLAALRDLSFTQPTPVQVRAIPLALQDNVDKPANDLLVSSQTGSGKTAAFLLPVMHTLLQQQKQAEKAENKAWADKVAQAVANGEEAPKKPRRKKPTDTRHVKPANPGALILCPTRELAQQVAKDAIDLVRHCKGLRIACVVGGMPYPLQIARLHNADLVVATPGRLLDLQRSKQLNLDKVQFLVVDEADRMLDLGFAEDLAEVHKLTQTRRQTMMFSATFAPRIQQLAARIVCKWIPLKRLTPTSNKCCFGLTTSSTSASCWTIGCAIPPLTKPLCLRLPKSNAMLWLKICNKWVFQRWLCTAP
jgi:superfamily II DNA/RNA helicase